MDRYFIFCAAPYFSQICLRDSAYNYLPNKIFRKLYKYLI